MDDMKDKVKGFMKKMNNSFTSSSSGGFKGQGRVLGSSSSSSSLVAANPIPNRKIPGLDSSKQNQPSSNSRPATQRPSASVSDKKMERPNSDFSDKKVGSRIEVDSNLKESATTKGFDPFDSFITSSDRNQNGYSLNIVECPACGGGYGSEQEVSDHIEHCLSLSDSGVPRDGNTSGLHMKNELETCIGAYISGKPSEGSTEVVLKLLKNVIKEPDNAKFRKIRMGNPKIKESIGDVVGAVELLECLGFKLEEEGGEMWLVMGIPSQEVLALIKKAVSMLEPQKIEESPSTSPAKGDETGEQTRDEPKAIDRQVKFIQFSAASVLLCIILFAF